MVMCRALFFIKKFLNEDNFTFLHAVYSFLFVFTSEEEVKTTLLGYIFFHVIPCFSYPCFVLFCVFILACQINKSVYRSEGRLFHINY